MQAAIDEGKQPFYVCAVAGTTVTGAFDSIMEIADVIERVTGMPLASSGNHTDTTTTSTSQRPVWLHVDGAWGGGVVASPTHRHKLAGAERVRVWRRTVC